MVIDDLGYRRLNVACLYADYKDQNNQTVGNILGTFLRQLLATQTLLPAWVAEELQVIQRAGGKAGLKVNLALLRKLLQQLEHAFICIDAVDELDSDVRWNLLKELKELGAKNTRLFLTGRNHIEDEVRKQFQILQGNKVIISATRQDIEEFVSQKINDNRGQNPGAMDDELAKDIIDIIIKKSQGM